MRHRPTALAVIVVCLALAGSAAAQRPAARPGAAGDIRALQGRDFTEAFAAAERLGDYAAQRVQVVPALLDLRETLQQALAP